MAFGVTAYSEAAFSAEDNNAIAYPQGIVLTGSMGEESNVGDANVNVTGIQATIINEGALGGSSISLSLTGSELTTFIGEEDINVGVPVTGIELSISNKTFTQDTLTAFGEAPFATLSPSVFEVPSVEVEATTGAGQLPSFLLQSTLGTFSVQVDTNVSVIVTEHDIVTSTGDVSVTGIANVSVTGTEMTMTLGDESAFTDHTVEVTGQELTMSMGEEDIIVDANVELTGNELTSSIGDVEQETRYAVTGVEMSTAIGSVIVTGTANVDVTGIQLQSNTGNVNITAWAEIDPGVSNVWTEVDLAAQRGYNKNMASTYSELGLELMVTGENAGIWGDKTNTNLNLVQQAIAGYQEISIAGGAQTTALAMADAAISNARNAVIKFTGTITGNQIVTIPDSIEKTYIISNGTTGAFTVEFKTVSGTGVTFSTTDKGIKILFSDGTNVVDVTGNFSNITTGSITASGNIEPGANDTYDLGASGNVWRNIYTGDLHLNNEHKEKGNIVDGSKGSWTLQEGSDNIYLINNKSNEKFRLKLEKI